MSNSLAKVVIVGSGHAGTELAATLRNRGFAGSIDLFSEDPAFPYQRPPLSKEYIKRPGSPLLLRTAEFYDANSINLHLGVRAESIDRQRKTVSVSVGSELEYDHLVLATGARNIRPTIPGIDHPSIVELRTLADAERMAKEVGSWKKAIIIGGGFIGLEAAGLLTSLDVEVEVIELSPRLMQRAVSPAISEWCLRYHEKRGVRFHLSRRAASITHRSETCDIELDNGVRISGDAVILAAGVMPNVSLAQAAGLDTANGIVVDAHLATNDRFISAIGDCAAYPNVLLSMRVRLESVQNATDHAKVLAENLLGEKVPYTALPWFWSVQGDARLQIVGITKPGLSQFTRGSYDEDRFSIFHFDEEKLLAVESINSPADHMASRRIISQSVQVNPHVLADTSVNMKLLVA